MAARILAQPQADRVYLRIEKLDRGPGALGVAIVRARATGAAPAPAPDDAAAPRPVLAVFDNAALGAADLARRLDALAAPGGAVVIAVTLPEGLPVAPDPAAQARIDLLGLEQNAWALAARDPRLSVVASRTEMDWAIRQGAMVVWAPSQAGAGRAGRAAGPGRSGAAGGLAGGADRRDNDRASRHCCDPGGLPRGGDARLIAPACQDRCGAAEGRHGLLSPDRDDRRGPPGRRPAAGGRLELVRSGRAC